MSKRRSGPIILTAGGTGGHVFPADALADALLARGHRLAFVTDSRGRNYGGTLGSLDTYGICAGGIAGRSLMARARALAELSVGFVQAHRLIRKLQPAAVVSFRALPYPAMDEGSPLRILILGGSQGARVLSEVVPAALTSLPTELRSRLSISQQCRSEDLDMVRKVYGEAGVHVSLASFFQDIPTRLADAHLVISRSGASTVAELTAVGRPAILVPFPHAVDDHQTANAHAVDETGGGWLIPQPAFTPETLAGRLRALFALPGTLARAAACARAAGAPDAAANLADVVESLMQGGAAR
jgi:UDP-N-acetylglucosamine:LPS N-acetylglucosamine transferase